MLIDVNHMMLLIVFDGHAEIEGDTPKIMDLEHLDHLSVDLPTQALISKDKVIIYVQNDCCNNHALIPNHAQSSIDM